MAFLKLSEIIQGDQSCLPTFGHLLMVPLRVIKALIFSLFLCSDSEVKEKINTSTSKNCHFKASVGRYQYQLWLSNH